MIGEPQASQAKGEMQFGLQTFLYLMVALGFAEKSS